MHCKPKPHGTLQTTIIENPGLMLVHDYHRIVGCISVSDWEAARPEMPICDLEADHWDRLGFDERHDAPTALFVNTQRQRLTLTGVGLFQCTLLFMLMGDGDSFNVENMVERILGEHAEDWHSAEDFLDTTVPLMAAQSGKLGSTIPGLNSDRRAYLSPGHQRLVAGEFWAAMYGPTRNKTTAAR